MKEIRFLISLLLIILPFQHLKSEIIIMSKCDDKQDEFLKNKDKQVKAFNYYIKNLESKKNLIFVTHYVFISEVLNYGPSSGEIVVSDKNLNIIGSIEIDF